jgi:hypothetical protein
MPADARAERAPVLLSDAGHRAVGCCRGGLPVRRERWEGAAGMYAAQSAPAVVLCALALYPACAVSVHTDLQLRDHLSASHRLSLSLATSSDLTQLPVTFHIIPGKCLQPVATAFGLQTCRAPFGRLGASNNRSNRRSSNACTQVKMSDLTHFS